MFQAVGPDTQKGRSSNLVQDDRLVTASITPDIDTDRRIDRISLMTSGKQRSAMYRGAIPLSALKTVMQILQHVLSGQRSQQGKLRRRGLICENQDPPNISGAAPLKTDCIRSSGACRK